MKVTKRLKTMVMTVKDILRRELLKRQTKNTIYSLRSFANHLGVSHSCLSLIMTNKRSLSKKLAQILIEKLNLSEEEKSIVLKTQGSRIEAKIPKPALDKREPTTGVSSINRLEHLAILALINLRGPLNREQLSSALERPIGKTKELLDSLCKGGYLQEHDGYFSRKQESLNIKTSQDNGIHEEYLKTALAALNTTSNSESAYSFNCVNVDQNNIPFLKEKIDEFLQTICQQFSSSESGGQISYCGIQLVPATTTESQKKPPL